MTQAIFKEFSQKDTQQKVLVFPAQAKSIEGKQVFFLFSLFQMEDVLTTIRVQEVPFSPAYISGISDWRGNVVPVISLEQLLGLEQETVSYSQRLAVIHSIDQSSDVKDDLWGMVQITRNIKMMTLPIPCTPSDFSFKGKEAFIRGVYEWEEGLLVVMNMENLLNGNISAGGHCVQ